MFLALENTLRLFSEICTLSQVTLKLFALSWKDLQNPPWIWDCWEVVSPESWHIHYLRQYCEGISSILSWSWLTLLVSTECTQYGHLQNVKHSGDFNISLLWQDLAFFLTSDYILNINAHTFCSNWHWQEKRSLHHHSKVSLKTLIVRFL